MIISNVYQRENNRDRTVRQWGQTVSDSGADSVAARRVLNYIINLSFCDLHDTFCLYLARRQIEILLHCC